MAWRLFRNALFGFLAGLNWGKFFTVDGEWINLLLGVGFIVLLLLFPYWDYCKDVRKEARR